MDKRVTLYSDGNMSYHWISSDFSGMDDIKDKIISSTLVDSITLFWDESYGIALVYDTQKDVYLTEDVEWLIGVVKPLRNIAPNLSILVYTPLFFSEYSTELIRGLHIFRGGTEREAAELVYLFE